MVASTGNAWTPWLRIVAGIGHSRPRDTPSARPSRRVSLCHHWTPRPLPPLPFVIPRLYLSISLSCRNLASNDMRIPHLRWLTPQMHAPSISLTTRDTSQVGSLFGNTPSRRGRILLLMGLLYPLSYVPLSFFSLRPLAPFTSIPLFFHQTLTHALPRYLPCA